MKRLLFSVFAVLLVLPLVFAVEVPINATFGGGASDWYNAGDNNWSSSAYVTYGSTFWLGYYFPEGFGDGINMTIGFDGEDGTAGFNITCGDYGFEVIMPTISPVNYTYTVPSQCLNASNYVNIYATNLGLSESSGHWFDTYFTSLEPPVVPSVNITLPLNQSYEYSSKPESLEFTVVDIDSCSYSVNNGVTNNSLGSCEGFSLSSVVGSNTWILYGFTDVSGSIDSTSEYSCTGTNCGNGVDGVLSTVADINSGQYLESNYTVPNDATSLSLEFWGLFQEMAFLNVTCRGTQVYYNDTNFAYLNPTISLPLGCIQNGEISLRYTQNLGGDNFALNDSVISYDYSDVTSDSVTFFVESEIVPEEESPPEYLSNPIYEVLSTSGVGFGLFIRAISQGLPLLLVVFVVVAGVGAILIGIVYAIKGNINFKGK
jgi:hypothetical protein